MFVSQELQFRATLIAQMNSHYTAALFAYLKRIKLVGVALALVFLANLCWSQVPAPGGIKPHCSMRINAMRNADAPSANHAPDCCPKRAKVPLPSNPDCCKYPCYTQAATQMPLLLSDAEIAVAVVPMQLPQQRYRDRLQLSFSPPELRPPIT